MYYRQKRVKNYVPLLALAGAVIVLVGAGWLARGAIREFWYDVTRPALPPAVEYVPPTPTTTAATSTAAVPTPTPTKPSPKPPTPAPTIQAEVNLAVPWLLQAPKQNWVQPFEDACEEASLLMVDAYYDGRGRGWTADEGIEDILDVVAFEDETYGYNKDTTAADVANTAKVKFGYKNTVVMDATEANIKKMLNEKRPVIIPAYGKALNNPNFRNGGPEYHMLVIKGYNKDGSWITNDPGTRRGADYVYPKQLLLDAIHDFDPRDMRTGRKVMIVVIP
ncbi:C39 family peptidase [Patescibacteria group bacterium]|nr:C39 family peptidase [Patescibacteria group bacterium]